MFGEVWGGINLNFVQRYQWNSTFVFWAYSSHPCLHLLSKIRTKTEQFVAACMVGEVGILILCTREDKRGNIPGGDQ